MNFAKYNTHKHIFLTYKNTKGSKHFVLMFTDNTAEVTAF